jgi:hypothetical protein
MTIESKHVIIKNTPQEVFNYLKDLNNFKQLLPQDRISEWVSSMEMCKFKIQGTATIELVYKSSEEFSHLHIVSGEASPFQFTLDIYIKPITEGCEAYQIFEGDINAFLKLLVEKPLTNLFNYIADKLAETKSL